VANGQVFVYRASGEPIGRIDVPERPTGLLFGGPDGRTLYVLSHRSLYAARMSHPGALSPSAQARDHRASPRNHEEPSGTIWITRLGPRTIRTRQ
jgi:hypothetical protein